MSLEQNVSPSPTSTHDQPASSAIENEFPTYRAVSPHAVLALIAGVLATFSVVHPFFLTCAVVAVLLGFYAERKIQSYSDVLTGRTIAQVGIFLGLVFGLGTVTIGLVQGQLRKGEAVAFSKQFVDVLKKGSLDDAVWFRQHPEIRRGKSVSEVKEDVLKGMRDARMFDMEYGTLKALKDRVGAAGGDVHFDHLEEAGSQDLDNFASAVVEVHGPADGKAPAEEHALLFLKSSRNPKNGKSEWWVEQVKYPYTPNTFVAPRKVVDDGHGHAH